VISFKRITKHVQHLSTKDLAAALCVSTPVTPRQLFAPLLVSTPNQFDIFNSFFSLSMSHVFHFLQSYMMLIRAAYLSFRLYVWTMQQKLFV
jgi:hypothetical protein